MFPPFSLVCQVLAKIYRDKTNAVIIVPDWSTQYWYTVATDDHPGPTVFSAVTKKLDIATQTLCDPPAIQKTTVNINQGNNTTEKKFRSIS